MPDVYATSWTGDWVKPVGRLYLGEAYMAETFEGERWLFAVSWAVLLSGVDATSGHRSNTHAVSKEQDHIASDVAVQWWAEFTFERLLRRRLPVRAFLIYIHRGP